MTTNPTLPAETAVAHTAGLLADIEAHLKATRVFIGSREKMHPCGQEMHDDLLARVSSAVEAERWVRTDIAWAICRALTDENIREVREFGNAGPIADAVLAAIARASAVA